jgi:hypothetical protein
LGAVGRDVQGSVEEDVPVVIEEVELRLVMVRCFVVCRAGFSSESYDRAADEGDGHACSRADGLGLSVDVAGEGVRSGSG